MAIRKITLGLLSLSIITISWLVAKNTLPEINVAIKAPLIKINPWLIGSLTHTTGIYLEKTELILNTFKSSDSEMLSIRALDTGIICKITREPNTQLSTVYILHKNQDNQYYCSIYSNIKTLSTSLNKLVTAGSKIGVVSFQNQWQAQLVNLQSRKISNISNKIQPRLIYENNTKANLSLNDALNRLQNRVQVQRFNQLPNLKIMRP